MRLKLLVVLTCVLSAVTLGFTPEDQSTQAVPPIEVNVHAAGDAAVKKMLLEVAAHQAAVEYLSSLAVPVEEATTPESPEAGTAAPDGSWGTGAPGGDCGGWLTLVQQFFPDDVAGACSRLVCESGGNPNAYNGATGVSGLMQIHPVHERRFIEHGWTWNDVWDPVKNLTIAAEIRRDRGSWADWACT